MYQLGCEERNCWVETTFDVVATVATPKSKFSVVRNLQPHQIVGFWNWLNKVEKVPRKKIERADVGLKKPNWNAVMDALIKKRHEMLVWLAQR
jgi:tetrahydromethanopterin S-methyltransferase subunit H